MTASCDGKRFIVRADEKLNCVPGARFIKNEAFATLVAARDSQKRVLTFYGRLAESHPR
jgi:hypothetical protein